MAEGLFCQECGTALTPDALACTNCQRLVHATDLAGLAARANEMLNVGNVEGTRAAYLEMLNLLPQGSSQFQAIGAKLGSLPQPPAEAPPPPPPPWKKLVSSFGVVGAIIWKFKAFAVLLLTKGKFLFFGLTKIKTLLSMLASMGVYWALYGWRYAVGIVVSIYIHEMGHMWAFRRFGIPATAPMFIPMFGAFIRAQAAILNPREEARIGLAGPWWGLGAALGFELLSQLFELRWMSAVAHTGAVINLFNLLPVFGLDGSHAYTVLGRRQRGMLLATMGLMWYLSGETMFFLVALGATYKMFTKDLPEVEDESIFRQFVALLAAFGLLSMLSAHWDRALIVGA